MKTINLQKQLVREKNIQIARILFLIYLRKIGLVLLSFSFIFIILGFIFKTEKVEVAKAEFIYTEEAKNRDLQAIKENREKYLAKKQAETIKIGATNTFKSKKVANYQKENKTKINSNKWTDEKVIEEAIKFLKKEEGVRYKAYWDYKQWSICYGYRSYRGATATAEECDKQLRERVQNELLRINRLADNIDGNKKVALISFFYNTGYNYRILNYARRGDDKSVIYLMNKYKYANGKYLKGLAKRRAKEIDYYINF